MLANNRICTKLLQNDEKKYWYNYNSPLGEMFLLGNDESLHAIRFKKEQSIIECAHIPRKKTAAIVSCMAILDVYFANNKVRKLMLQGHLLGQKKQLKIIGTFAKNNIELLLDLAPFTEKECIVYHTLLKVTAGKTISYNGLALQAGFPRAARFVGTSMAKNLFPIIVPCHRVIPSSGSLGNYSAGVEKKKYLLAIESDA